MGKNIISHILSTVCCFFVGGFFALVGQLIFSFLQLLLDPSFPLLPVFSLVGLSAASSILWYFGVMQKLEKLGAYGAMLHFGSCACACARYCQAAYQQSSSIKTAVKAGFVPVLQVCIPGTIAAGILALLVELAL